MPEAALQTVRLMRRYRAILIPVRLSEMRHSQTRITHQPAFRSILVTFRSRARLLRTFPFQYLTLLFGVL